MFNDDDFGSFFGGFDDLSEYMSEEDDYQRSIKNGKGGDPLDFGDVDDDWEICYLDIANKYGLNPYDYADAEEFLEALKLEAENNNESDTPGLHCDLGVTNPSLMWGAAAAAASASAKSESEGSVEDRYYDAVGREYRIGDAIYDNFKEVRDNYEKHECEAFSTLIYKIYRVDKELGVAIWVWAIHNFQGALVNRGVDEWNLQAWSLTDCIFSNFATADNESDNEEENTFIFRYVSKNPDLEEIIYNKTYVGEHLRSLTEYVPYCVENNLRDNFLRVYNGIMTNPLRKEEKMSKYSIIENLLVFCNVAGVTEADPWFYAFFEKEIKALNKPLKEAYLMTKLNDERYGKRIFLKPEKENLELDDEYFGKSDTAGEISAEEYKKLKNENKALKAKVTRLEKKITDLNYCIGRLEKNLAAARKVKEWDGKYYRYCKVTMDENPNGLWYRTDDITLKKGDYVYVPYGHKNEELMAKVVQVEDFRSDDLPFPLEKTKFISEKCDA